MVALVDDCCDSFDLHKLVWVAKYSDSDQCARNFVVSESGANNTPCGHKVRSFYGRYEDSCGDHVLNACTGFFQSNAHVVEGFLGLCRVVAKSARRPIVIQGASTG